MWKRLLFVLLVSVPVTAFAQDAELVFRALDSNGDGAVNQQEAQANELVSEYFSAADIDNDGALSFAEFAAAFGAE
jgi:Ca2+-binding EF-hand superfamily protein